MAAVWTLETTSFPTNPYLGVDSSAINTTFYAAGVVQYWIFVPDASAIASAGWTGKPIPAVLQCQGTGTGNLTAVGANEGEQMNQMYGTKMGFNWAGAHDGSAQNTTPAATWPAFVICPQFLFSAPSGSEPNSGNRLNRVPFMIIEACVKDAWAKYNIDRTRTIITGHSGGAGTALQYTYARSRWPQHFAIAFSAQIIMAGTVNGSGSSYRSVLPEMEQNENSTTQTCPRILAKMSKVPTPTWFFNSTNDAATTPAIYQPTFTMLQQWTPLDYGVAIPAGSSAGTMKKGGQWLRYTEYTGGSAPNHQSVWDLTLGNNAVGGAMAFAAPVWQWAFAQQFRPRISRYSRLARITGRGL